MYLSHLLIDTGTNPDKPRPGRTWLRNIYHVHQRLCMAFPSNERKNQDPHFLKPYKPDDFRPVHIERNEDSGFLFRIDPHPGGNVSIIVLSAKEPNWDYAFYNADYLLAAPPSSPKPLELHIETGAKFRFKLKANPTRRLSKNSVDKMGNRIEEKKIGDRVPVPFEKLEEWLARKGEQSGFKLIGAVEKNAGYGYFEKSTVKEQNSRLISVLFEGILEVTDECEFRKALLSGIGSAKAFGFGLLTIAPV